MFGLFARRKAIQEAELDAAFKSIADAYELVGTSMLGGRKGCIGVSAELTEDGDDRYVSVAFKLNWPSDLRVDDETCANFEKLTDNVDVPGYILLQTPEASTQEYGICYGITYWQDGKPFDFSSTFTTKNDNVMTFESLALIAADVAKAKAAAGLR